MEKEKKTQLNLVNMRNCQPYVNMTHNTTTIPVLDHRDTLCTGEAIEYN